MTRGTRHKTRAVRRLLALAVGIWLANPGPASADRPDAAGSVAEAGDADRAAAPGSTPGATADGMSSTPAALDPDAGPYSGSAPGGADPAGCCADLNTAPPADVMGERA
jgi:hypothetical protein